MTRLRVSPAVNGGPGVVIRLGVVIPEAARPRFAAIAATLRAASLSATLAASGSAAAAAAAAPTPAPAARFTGGSLRRAAAG
jgi:hypothetical protein